jgi:hypothetical protein
VVKYIVKALLKYVREVLTYRKYSYREINRTCRSTVSKLICPVHPSGCTYCHIGPAQLSVMGQDSSVGIASRYGLDGPGIESQWGEIFSAPVQTGHGAHPASYTMGTESFPGIKRSGHGVDHPSQSKAEVKERVEL